MSNELLQHSQACLKNFKFFWCAKVNIPQWTVTSTEDRLELLQTHLKHLLGQPTGAAVCAAVSVLCFENLSWKFLLGLTEDSQRRLRSISVLLLHVRMLQPRTGLFLKKGGSELVLSWFLAEVDSQVSGCSRYGAALQKHCLAENTAFHSSSQCRTEAGTLLWAADTCPAMVRVCHRAQTPAVLGQWPLWHQQPQPECSSTGLGLRNAGELSPGLRTWAFVPGRDHVAN